MGPLIDGVPLAGIVPPRRGRGMIGAPFFRRAIWRAFVMAAADVHYAAVLTGVVFA